jgi:hypothetical protein
MKGMVVMFFVVMLEVSRVVVGVRVWFYGGIVSVG